MTADVELCYLGGVEALKRFKRTDLVSGWVDNCSDRTYRGGRAEG